MPKILSRQLSKGVSPSRGTNVQERLSHLSQLSGLTAAEKELVSYWNARGIPANHQSSFQFMWQKHGGRVDRAVLRTDTQRRIDR
jgi:hypothetical protein